jgi:hypothetical protein
MTPKLSQYLNKNVLVSIPALFEDGACRPFRLLGAELHGLWLQSEDLARRLLQEDNHGYASAAPVVFVPFAQIAAVLIATKPVPEVAASQKSNVASNAPAAESHGKRKK